ncbi:GreA/GreB family elongation factor [Candidatus Falkowbacteria bacterium]|nr:GreA/GreB family elongation factor [Candidatus Falkowbacteria bacterium]
MQTPKRKPSEYALIPPDFNITQEKLDEFQDELQHLISVSRPKTIDDMQAAAAHGDFSENHPYQSAKARLRGINDRITQLEKFIAKAIIIRPHNDGFVHLGSKVTVEVNNKIKEYTILGSQEVNPDAGVISHNSPLGSLLMNHAVGDVVILDNGEKRVEYKIVMIS